jgi:hypothetical protein
VRSGYIGPEKIVKPIYKECLSRNKFIKGEAGRVVTSFFIYRVNG